MTPRLDTWQLGLHGLGAMETVHPSPPVAIDSRNSLFARIIGNPLFWWVAVGLLFGVPLGRSLTRKLPAALPVLGEIPSFQTTFVAGPHAGEPFNDFELRGRVWVATFIDPTDPACDRLAEGLEKFQRRARNLGDSWRVISFTPSGVDANGARSFFERHHPNPFRWYFMAVGAPVETAATQALYRSGAVAPVGTRGSDVVHSKHLVALVDRNRRIRGYYDIESTPGLDAILSDAGLLANLDR